MSFTKHLSCDGMLSTCSVASGTCVWTEITWAPPSLWMSSCASDTSALLSFKRTVPNGLGLYTHAHIHIQYTHSVTCVRTELKESMLSGKQSIYNRTYCGTALLKEGQIHEKSFDSSTFILARFKNIELRIYKEWILTFRVFVSFYHSFFVYRNTMQKKPRMSLKIQVHWQTCYRHIEGSYVQQSGTTDLHQFKT